MSITFSLGPIFGLVSSVLAVEVILFFGLKARRAIDGK